MKKELFGIDLGAAYSSISIIDENGKPQILRNSMGALMTPSVVFFEGPSEEGGKINVTVGQTAKDLGSIDPDNVVAFIKQQMGLNWKKEFFGMEFTPEMISAEIIRNLVRDVWDMHQIKVEDVVITCPTYVGDKEREATKAAGILAGLNVIGILDETVATALCYGLNKSEGDRTAVIYDLGASFNVAVISIKDNIKSIVCSDGDHQAGGKLWDKKIAENLAAKFIVATGVDFDQFMNDKYAQYDLQLQAEKIKMKFRALDSVKTKITFDKKSEIVEIKRAEFDEISEEILERTLDITQNLIDIAKGKGIEKIDDFLLVGGTTMMPQVYETIKKRFASQVENAPAYFEPAFAVAKGAAIFASLMMHEES